MIDEEAKYGKYFYDFIAMKDEEIKPFMLKYDEATLSNEVVDSIINSIKIDRDAMIAEARINYPLKTFQGIDTNLRYASVMQNLSSIFTKSSKGIVKHIELKLGLIVPKPMQRSFCYHLRDTYTREQ